MKNIAISCLSIAAFFEAAIASPVTFREDSTVLPTYAPGGYDKTPLFYTGRVYQGAQGRVYPYPMQDVLFDFLNRIPVCQCDEHRSGEAIIGRTDEI